MDDPKVDTMDDPTLFTAVTICISTASNAGSFTLIGFVVILGGCQLSLCPDVFFPAAPVRFKLLETDHVIVQS